VASPRLATHVLERVIGSSVDRLLLTRDRDYAVDLEAVLRRAPLRTRIWIDETYVEYAGAAQSHERFAAQSENVIVCKSMSKVYALSGARAAYLCAGPHQLESCRAIKPLWVVGLPTQVAAVRALQDPGYYAAGYAETAAAREQLAIDLRALGWDVLPGIANFLLCHLPPDGPAAATIVRRCRPHGVFLRRAATMSASLGVHTIRLAVKAPATHARLVALVGRALAAHS
jgi:histidinol-phosphate/aromatic aminotransferase/cobyric acid decarboxylase-like protein